MSKATAGPIADPDDGKTETTQESPLDGWTQQASSAANLIHASRIIAERLELGDGGDELALSAVIEQAGKKVDELFGNLAGAAA